MLLIIELLVQVLERLTRTRVYFISPWNLEVCIFSTFLGYVDVEEDMLSPGVCFLTCIFNSVFLVNLMLTLPHGLGPLNFKHHTSRSIISGLMSFLYKTWFSRSSNVPQHSKFIYDHIKVAKIKILNKLWFTFSVCSLT